MLTTILILAQLATAPVCVPCAVERWEVKTGCDAAVLAVDQSTPISTTIADMRGLTPPANIKKFKGRAPGVEDRTFLIEATLTMFKTESDRDFHLVLSDHGATMIAEIPNPSCVSKASPYYGAVASVNEAFVQHFGNVKGKKNLHVRVRVTGVGFFDFIHGQTGVAPNGIELHPVTAIEFVDGETCYRSQSDPSVEKGQ